MTRTGGQKRLERSKQPHRSRLFQQEAPGYHLILHRAGRYPESCQSANLRSRNALAITETELNVIAALAIMGLRRTPRNG